MTQPAPANPLLTLLARLRHEVVGRDLADAPLSERALILPVRVAILAGIGIFRHQILVFAAALTYISIVSLVPTLAVAFAMFKAFGGLEQAQRVLMPKLMAYVAVGSQAVVEAKVQEFVDNVQSGTIGSVGIVVLLFVVVFLLSAIEYAFNQIFESPRPRAFLHRVAAYWTLVTITPTALLIGVGMPATLKRFAPAAWTMLDGTTLGSCLLVVPSCSSAGPLSPFIPGAVARTRRSRAPWAAARGSRHGYAYYHSR
jgi:hypothetical protein